MPRSSRSRATPAPAARAPSQTRSSSTAAAAPHAPTTSMPPPNPASAATNQQPKQPGMLGQMAATAGSVAMGSVMGHAVSGLLFGGGGNAATAQAQEAPAPPPTQQHTAPDCGRLTDDLILCLKNKGDCTWYLQQLEACKAAAAPY